MQWLFADTQSLIASHPMPLPNLGLYLAPFDGAVSPSLSITTRSLADPSGPKYSPCMEAIASYASSYQLYLTNAVPPWEPLGFLTRLVPSL